MYSLNLCESFAVLGVLDRVATATARKRRNSSGMALVLIATCHDARAHVLEKAYFGYITIAQDGE